MRDGQPISKVLTHRQYWNIKEVQYRLLQVTQFKQSDVSREFRHRLKVEFDLQGLPLPQLKVWLKGI